MFVGWQHPRPLLKIAPLLILAASLCLSTAESDVGFFGEAHAPSSRSLPLARGLPPPPPPHAYVPAPYHPYEPVYGAYGHAHDYGYGRYYE